MTHPTQVRGLWAAVVYAAALGFGRGPAAQEEPPYEFFKEHALAVSIAARLEEGPASAAWASDSVRYTVPGNPVSVKLVGSNVVILVQLTPFDNGKGGLVLVSQGQIWYRRGEGELSYRTTVDSVALKLGEPVIFFPLGRDPAGRAPMRLIISVDRYRGEGGKPSELLPATGPPPPAPPKPGK